jgi:hypothetical protein
MVASRETSGDREGTGFCDRIRDYAEIDEPIVKQRTIALQRIAIIGIKNIRVDPKRFHNTPAIWHRDGFARQVRLRRGADNAEAAAVLIGASERIDLALLAVGPLLGLGAFIPCAPLARVLEETRSPLVNPSTRCLGQQETQ